jgi:hypothetical protein
MAAHLRVNRVAGLALAAAVAIGAGVWLGSAWHTRSVPVEQAGAMGPPPPSTGAPRATAVAPAGTVALRPFEAVPMAPEAGKEASKEASKEAVDRPPQRSFENYPRHSGR